jgi:hypothetical protein
MQQVNPDKMLTSKAKILQTIIETERCIKLFDRDGKPR